MAQLRELGYFGLTIPERYGGLGLSTLAHLVVQEELGRAHAAFNMLISGNNGIGVMALVLAGLRDAKRALAAAAGLGRVDRRLRAHRAERRLRRPGDRDPRRPRGDRWVLNGTKHYISRGDIAELVTVFARDRPERKSRARGGITAFVVEKGTPGFRVARIQDSMGSDVIKQAELVFEDCVVSGDEVVGEVGQGFSTAMRILDLGRLSLAARCLGTMEELLALSAEHAATACSSVSRSPSSRRCSTCSPTRRRHRACYGRPCTRRQIAATQANG